MCTAIFDNTFGNLFGRTLDLEYSLGEEVIVCHRCHPIEYRHVGGAGRKYTVMGAGTVRGDFPLLYDAMNERGVAAAALNFPFSAKYADFKPERINLASFELIPFILGECSSLDEVRSALSGVNITRDGFSSELPPSPLHWIFADKSGAVVAESTERGLEIHDDPVGVLTNEPPFAFQLTRLADYARLDSAPPRCTLCHGYTPPPYSRGIGGAGLPGDYSSASRFVRAVFVKNHTSPDGAGHVERFFHLMGSVFVPRGCVLTEEGLPVETVYTSCMDLDSLSYHFTTYSSSAIRTLTLSDGVGDNTLLRYPMVSPA